MLDRLTHHDFQSRLHQPFTIHVEGLAPLEAALIQVTPLGTAPAEADRRQPFSLVLRGPAQPILPQHIYQVRHKTLEPLDIFLVPLGPDQSGGIRYEAIFT